MVATYLPQDASVPLFAVDYEVVGHMAGQHLADLGHRRCLYLHFVPALERDIFALARWRGFQAGGGEGFAVEAMSLESVGAEGLKARLARGDLTAVFCQNDRSLPTVYRVAWELGLSVPRDLSVIGSVDMEIAEMLSPKATTIEVAKQEVARAATLSIIETPRHAKAQGRIFPPSLVVRESTAVVRK